MHEHDCCTRTQREGVEWGPAAAAVCGFMIAGSTMEGTREGGRDGSRHLIFYPLRVEVRQISGLHESLDCPSDWFVGVAEEGATPTNQ